MKYTPLILCIYLLLLNSSCHDQSISSSNFPIKDYPDRKNDFSLWQLEAFEQHVQMGYVIRTDDNKIIVIDGGGLSATLHLENFLIILGGHVDYWFITHPHTDHADALLEIIRRKQITISSINHALLNSNWVFRNEQKFFESFLLYNATLNESGITLNDLHAGDLIELGNGVKAKVLGARNDEIVVNAVNNSSLVFKVESKNKSVLFLGDLGVEGGEKLLSSEDSILLKSDYVQMSHHGSDGVEESFYKAVQPYNSLWPTPDWLWNNNIGEGFNSAYYNTVEVRNWLLKLNVKEYYVSGISGTVQID